MWLKTFFWYSIYNNLKIPTIRHSIPQKPWKARTQFKHEKQQKKMKIIPKNFLIKFLGPTNKFPPRKKLKKADYFIKKYGSKNFSPTLSKYMKNIKNVKKFHSKLKHSSYILFYRTLFTFFFITFPFTFLI